MLISEKMDDLVQTMPEELVESFSVFIWNALVLSVGVANLFIFIVNLYMQWEMASASFMGVINVSVSSVNMYYLLMYCEHSRCGVITVACISLVLLHVAVTTTRDPPSRRFEEEKYFLDPRKGSGRQPRLRFPTFEDMPTIDLSIIVPAYNEAKRLPAMLDDCMKFFLKNTVLAMDYTFEIIVVDDGSKDDTSKVALGYSEKYGTDKIRVLRLEENRGKGGAVRLGVQSSRGWRVLFADADGAAEFQDIIKLLKKMDSMMETEEERAVVVGSRAHLEEESVAQRSMFRTMLMKGFHLLVWALAVRGVKDTQCGFKLFTRNSARVLFSNLHVQRWAFDVELLYVAETLRIRVAEVAIRWQEIDGSKMTPVFSWIEMGRDLLYIRLRHATGLWTINDTVDIKSDFDLPESHASPLKFRGNKSVKKLIRKHVLSGQ